MIVDAFFKSQLDVLIFLSGDRTRLPLSLLEGVEREFVALRGYDFVDVYVRRDPAENSSNESPSRLDALQ